MSGAVERAGVIEVPIGTPLHTIVERAGPVGAAAAALVGGFFGTWVPAEGFGLAFSRAGLPPAGASPGAGVVIVLPDGACGLSGRRPGSSAGTQGSPGGRVDMIPCAGDGICAELLAEWIRLDDWGHPIIRREAIPPELMRQARWRCRTARPRPQAPDEAVGVWGFTLPVAG